jgi:hypothetical protein
MLDREVDTDPLQYRRGRIKEAGNDREGLLWVILYPAQRRIADRIDGGI